MGSKERIQRLKDDTRLNILEAALQIVKEEGWQSLSMRKIADQIEYTAPIIYEYFSNKDGILLELTRRGYLILARDIREARDKHESAADKMEAMWVAYWNFAFAHKEFYQLMYGVDMVCCTVKKSMPEAENVSAMLGDVIESLFNKKPVSENDICMKYYTYWSIIHGLISINLVRPNGRTTDELNQQILKDAIKGINPLVDANTSITDAIIKMTEYGYGCVTIVNTDGSIKGIFTDSDLRRIITEEGRDVLSKKMIDLNYKTPISIDADELLNEAAAIFKKTAVDTILVTKNGKPFGMLDIQDLQNT